MTGFFVRPDVFVVDAGVAVFDAFPFAFAGAFFGVVAGSSTAFLTGPVRLGLFELAKKSDVVVSSSTGSGVGSRLAFFAAGFFGVVFLGLCTVSFDVARTVRVVHFASSSSSSSESSTTRLARPFFLGAAFFGAGSSFFFASWLPFGGPPPKKLRMSAGIFFDTKRVLLVPRRVSRLQTVVEPSNG